MLTYEKACKNKNEKTEPLLLCLLVTIILHTDLSFLSKIQIWSCHIPLSSLSGASAHTVYFYTSPFLFMLSFFSPFGKNLAHLLKSCSRINSLGKKKKSHIILPIFLVNNCFPLPLHPSHMFITWSWLPIFPARQGLPWRHSVSQSLTDGRYSKNVKEVNYHFYLTSSKAVELFTDNVNAFINYKILSTIFL